MGRRERLWNPASGPLRVGTFLDVLLQRMAEKQRLFRLSACGCHYLRAEQGENGGGKKNQERGGTTNRDGEFWVIRNGGNSHVVKGILGKIFRYDSYLILPNDMI